MIRRPVSPSTALRRQAGIDPRIWWMVMAIGFFAVLVLKEIQLPSPVILGFGAVGLFGLLMTGLQDPVLPFYVLVAYMPFSRVLVGDFGTQATALNMTNILMILVFIGYIINRISSRKPISDRAPMNKVVLLFCVLGAVSLVHAGWEYGSWYVAKFIIPLKQWLTPVAMYFLALNVTRERKSMKAVVVIIMVAVTIVGLMAIYDYIDIGEGGSFDRSRVGGIAEQPNTLGAFFNYYMFLLFGFFLTYFGRASAWLLLIPFLICFRGIMVTFSRGAYLGFAMGGMASCFFKSKRLFLAAIAMAVMALMTPILIPAGIRYRMGMTYIGERNLEEGPTQGLEASAAQRIAIWKGGLEMVKENPWWGVGYGAFPSLIPLYTHGTVGYRDAHNSYMLIAAEMGLPTLAIFLIILMIAGYYTHWVYTRTTEKFFKATALGFLAGLCALLVANLFGSRMDDQAVSSYFWVLCGLMMRLVLTIRQEDPTTRSRHGRLVRRLPPMAGPGRRRIATA